MRPPPSPVADTPPPPRADTVGDVAELYLGNILYSIERCALALEAEEKAIDAAFYRAIGRKLAEAHGRSRSNS